MKPCKKPQNHVQPDLFKPLLRDIVDPAHPLIRLADSIDWSAFEDSLEPCFSDTGRQAKPVRLMVALHYLKYAFDQSDESVLAVWIENPYWQYFSGGSYFEHATPLDSSSMTRWRAYLKEAGVEEMLAETIKTGLREKMVKKSDLKRVNVDTTVQEKDIRHPTDSRLYDRSRERLVRAARERGIVLRQSYARVGKRALRCHSGYASARQMRRARRQEKKLRVFLGRVARDIRRKCANLDAELLRELQLAERLIAQKRKDSKKLYSLHEPHVECIAKGKAHKRYEFGCKAGFVTSAKTNWVLGAKAFHGNPYDGHTLSDSLHQTERLTGVAVEQATCDLGYRGHGYQGQTDVQIVKRKRKRLSKSLRMWWKRRSAIEPVIGHMKSDCRMDRNRLKGEVGDRLNAILCACGFNLRKLLRGFAFFCAFVRWILRCGTLLGTPAPDAHLSRREMSPGNGIFGF